MPEKVTKDKVLCYVVSDGKLLVPVGGCGESLFLTVVEDGGATGEVDIRAGAR
ncbi:hypothetical protein ABZ876_29770 [Streptomyces sp. NPDC046931]|uniref:hypothetical protein n=1 Tax=Streptomyces sp. NPDC046931 TaxID=3154806 RepID=UPI0033C77E87